MFPPIFFLLSCSENLCNIIIRAIAVVTLWVFYAVVVSSAEKEKKCCCCLFRFSSASFSHPLLPGAVGIFNRDYVLSADRAGGAEGRIAG